MNKEPFKKFAEWLEKATVTKEIVEPTAMCLATVDENKNLRKWRSGS